jgi:hypothetical protein
VVGDHLGVPFAVLDELLLVPGIGHGSDHIGGHAAEGYG